MGRTADPTWTIEPHVCVVCFGRILSRPREDGETTYRCADCGGERTGRSAAVVCVCGFKVQGRTSIGMRCEPNPQRSPEFPPEYIARQS